MTTKTRKAATKSAPAKAEIDWQATFVEALNAPGALGNTYNRFYNYSFLNQIRLMMQGCIEPVATYRKWTELGFQVQKGKKAKAVLAPMIITKRDEAGKPKINKTTGKPETVLIGFKESRTVFGFSDTDGDELPDVALPRWDSKAALSSLGVARKRFRHSDGNCQGYSSEVDGKKEIAINPAAAYPQKTLLHELAHIVLGHCKAIAEDEGEAGKHRGLVEFEAETTAYLVAKELQLTEWSPEESRAYINDWLQGYGHDPEGDNGPAYGDREISRIFAAANKILNAGKPQPESE